MLRTFRLGEITVESDAYGDCRMASLYFGDRDGAAQYLKGLGRRYYVYVLRRPSGEPFYVGKGMGRRALEHELEARRSHPISESNPSKCNVIRKLISNGETITYEIDSDYDLDGQLACLERDTALITRYGRLHEGGCLTNLASGVGSMAGAAPFSLERHSATLSGEPDDNPDRATLNRFLLAIGPVSSVPIKPVGQIARILPSTPHPQPRSPSLRCAYALVASAAASALPFRNSVNLPRLFIFDGVQAIIENGVCRDILKAGMATLNPAADPRQESFHLDNRQTGLIVALLGRTALLERSLL